MEKLAVIYTRVSDPSQVENNSLDSQEKICREFALSRGYKIKKVFREEGKSAKHVYTRPVLNELLQFAIKKSNTISAMIVYRFDRFSRSTEEGLATCGFLARHKVDVISATEPTDQGPMGTAMRSIMLALGQLDNEQKGLRVRDNMKASFRSGLWPFKPPVGYKRKFRTVEENKKLPLLRDSNLAPIVTRMFENAAKGIYSESQLARIMNLEGFGDFYKAKASHKIVKNILSRTFYYGNMHAPKWDEYVVGQHEPLINEAIWQKAYQCVILKKKSHSFQDSTRYPLKGTLCCEYCEHPMTSSPSRGRHGLVYYYECRLKDCRKLRINTKKAHTQFEELLANIQPSSRVIKLFQHMVFSEWDKVINQTKEQIVSADKRIATLKKELVSIRKATDNEIYTPEEAKEEADRIRVDIRVIEIERSEIRIEQYNSEIVKEFTTQFLQNLPFLWTNLDLPKKQAFLNKVFDGKIICTKNHEIRTLKLSPSFELIKALAAQNDQKVSREGLEPPTRKV